MKIVDYPLSAGQWYPEKQVKKYIIWHGTQGRTAYTPSNGQPGKATSSIDGWNDNPDHIGTPFLVDRDGTIFRTFKDETEWIYHLGLQGTNGRYDKASIGIEFANELELSKSDDGKYYAFDRVGANYQYTGPVLERSWRAHNWWAKLDAAQVDAAIELTLDLCARHGIPKTFYYPSTTYDFPHCFEVASILCHSNCRQDKSDMILEDWVWAKLQAAGFQLIGSGAPGIAAPAVAVGAPVAPPAAVTSPVTATPVPSYKATVTSHDGTLNVRAAANASAKILRTLNNGDIVDVFGASGGWSSLAANGGEWAASAYLERVTHAGTPAGEKAGAAEPPPTEAFHKTLAEVFNRGTPKTGFLQELVAWGRSAADEIFAEQTGNDLDIYARTVDELGPFEGKDIIYRKACMLEVMRVLAGFESSWKWTEGIDTNNPHEDSPDTISAGAFQVSSNSMGYGSDLRALVAPHGILKSEKDGNAFQAIMKSDHSLAMEYIARLIRHTYKHNGPLYKGQERSKFKPPENKQDHSIYPWLSQAAVAEFQKLLT